MKRPEKTSIKSTAQSGPKHRGSAKRRFRWQWVLVFVVGAILFSLSYWGKVNWCLCVGQRAEISQASTVKSPETLKELLSLPPAEVDHCEIALMDLLCAQGAPGSESMNIAGCLEKLDQWAAHVQSETERNLQGFREHPGEYSNSEGYYRMLMMAVVLYEDSGIRYNPDRITMPGKIDATERFFASAQDIFLNGLIEGQRMGTCSSMPVLYIAIGRRLGYPLKLVTTKAHLFVRWESDEDYFDVEATGKGMNRYDDEHFKQWPFPVTDAEVRTEGFLKSLTAAEELAVFFSLRGNCLKTSGHLKEARECYAKALQLAPTRNAYRALLADAEASDSLTPSAAKYIQTPQTRETAGSEFPQPTFVSPDPNPLKKMNGQ